MAENQEPKPVDETLADEELDQVSGGVVGLPLNPSLPGGIDPLKIITDNPINVIPIQPPRDPDPTLES